MKTIEQRAIEFIEAHSLIHDARKKNWHITEWKLWKKLQAKRANALRFLSYAVYRKVKR